MARYAVKLVVGALLALAAATAVAADEGGGWVVRICRDGTEASAIQIWVGQPKSPDQLLVGWKSDMLETDFPVKDKTLAASERIRVRADSEPPDGEIAMCVLHAGVPVKAMNFIDLLEVTARRNDKPDDACECPKGQ